MDNLIFQQGDVVLKLCGNHGIFNKEYSDIPKDAKLVQGNLILKGQTNSHALYGGKFQLLEHDGVLFLNVTKDTVLDHVKDHMSSNAVHAEHHAQTIPVGKYFKDAVMEYDHLLEESRQVID